MRVWLLVLVALLLLVVTALPVGVHAARVTAGGKPLLEALLLRSRIGDLPLGPSTPPIWALARSAAGAPTPSVPRPPDTVAKQLAVERLLRRAAAALGRAGSSERLTGIALGMQGQYAQAQAALAQALTTHPNDQFARLAAGNVLDALGQRQAALDVWSDGDLRRAIAFQLHRQGSQLAKRGARSQAEQVLRLASEIDPTFADPYYTLAGFYWGQDNQQAAAMLQAALAAGGLQPYFAHLAEAKLALLDSRPADAVAPLQAASQLRPEEAEPIQLLGSALRRLGNFDEAIRFLTDAAQRNPKSPWPLIQLGQLYLQLGDTDRAAESLTQAINRRADLPLAFDLLAQTYLAAGRPAQAASVWGQAVKLAPDSADYQVKLGDAWLQAGRPVEAAAAYRAALGLDPENVAARRQLRALGEPATDSGH